MSSKKNHAVETQTQVDLNVTPGDAASRNIWLAGLGALAQAQAEGGKVFESLVRDGIAAQQAAQNRMQEMTQRMEALKDEVVATAPRWPGLESIFETRVAKALEALGAPSQTDWQQMLQRLEALERALGQAPSGSNTTTQSARPNPSRRGTTTRRASKG